MDPKGEELAAVIAEIRQRVRSRHPNGVVVGNVALPDLTPLLHARDAAEGKVASIGTVNPRPPGLKNDIIQAWKRMLARLLDWHVREQVEFNRAVMACVQATLESLSECNQALSACNQAVNECHRELARLEQESKDSLAALGARLERDYKESIAALGLRLDQESSGYRMEARELKDIRLHWQEWRAGWEQKLANNEIHLLRSFAELQASFQHRVTLMDAAYRDQVKAQHADYEAVMLQQNQSFWAELERARAEYERIIHAELRVVRQRATLVQSGEQVAPAAPPQPVAIDWLKFADRFRGTPEDIRGRQQMYAARFRESAPVLDIGCGRGEMLEIFREVGIQARGIDLNDDSIALCLANGLDAAKADLFTYLSALPDSSLGGVISCQVVEHLPPDRLPELMRLMHLKLRTGGLVAIETPNPECLAIFATHFYLDPTRRHPIPLALMSFYLEEAGFGRIQVERLSPAIESLPSLAELPENFRKDFFGGLDYAVFAIKL